MEYAILINLGNKCNLNCKYCFERDNTGTSVVSKEVLDKIIEYINSKVSEKIHLILFGGEPTLYLKEIEYLFKNIKYKNNIIFSLPTNGAFLEGLLVLRDKYNVELSISLTNRHVNKEEDIWNVTSISYFKLLVSEYTLDDITEEYLSKLNNNINIKNVLIRFDFNSNWRNINQQRIVDVLNRINTYTLFPKSKFSFSTVNIPTSIMCTVNCTMRELNINYNGDVYLCHRDMNSNENPVIIGNILTDTIDSLYLKQENCRQRELNSYGCYYLDATTSSENLIALNNAISNSNINNRVQLNNVMPLSCA